MTIEDPGLVIDMNNEQHLKTPTGQSSGQYITPTSNMGFVPSKKIGQNAPQQLHHVSRLPVNVSAGAPSLGIP